ncbi:30S ribosomal protein S17 [candidate division LCP-89 bacterium B3_LCP]|uniref:Small ribosomal subunit protein uS17 n=1 Tax=candidate division LCP-89 bacterium B3_LCP TaxID=2012998 RepID=A0A532UZV8_UNCL8|nr:MAG: 30S ribosomal protein S17 [candidate division LCP-89 bacterium B3_LCP]
MDQEIRKPRKVKIGTVVSDKMDKTITVTVERRVPHPLYKKYFKRSNRFFAHDPENAAGQGDTVRIMECRPLSRHKSWRLVEVIEKAK